MATIAANRPGCAADKTAAKHYEPEPEPEPDRMGNTGRKKTAVTGNDQKFDATADGKGSAARVDNEDGNLDTVVVHLIVHGLENVAAARKQSMLMMTTGNDDW